MNDLASVNQSVTQKALIVFGPSGSGKDTLCDGVLGNPAIYRCRKPVTVTTRAPRLGEKEGVSYYYVSHRKFAAMVKAGKFIEHVIFAGNQYGTLKSELIEILYAGMCPLFNIEYRGARTIVRYLGSDNVRTIMIQPPSITVLAERLLKRYRITEVSPEIRRRLITARHEMNVGPPMADRIIVNRSLGVAKQLFQSCLRELMRELGV